MENKTNLIDKNNYNLDLVVSKNIAKRIQRELTAMYKLYDVVTVELSIKSKDCIITVHELVYGKINCYKFCINNNYPFSCPTVFLNNQPYLKLLSNLTAYEKQPYSNALSNKTKCKISNLKNLTGFDCLCCSSITCRNNWSPCCVLTNIIDEIQHFKKIKKNLVLKIFADKIKYKYLIEDIDLDSWLF